MSSKKTKLELTWIGKEHRPKLEPKSRKELEDPIVVAKKEAAEKWCERASAHNAKHAGKPWKYALIAHDTIAENMTIERLAT